MCGRYNIVSIAEIISRRFKLVKADFTGPLINIGPGEKGLIICSDTPDIAQMATFGLSPSFSNKQLYLFNARLEGKSNPENNPDYMGTPDIINMPSFRNAIRNQRCLVICDAFIEGPAHEKLKKPYLVFPRFRKRPFAMAGIWEDWVNKETGEISRTFAIITTPANPLLTRIGHHRSPMVLPPDFEQYWLHHKGIPDLHRCLRAQDWDLFNAYPVSADISKIANKDKTLLYPTGETLMPDDEEFSKIKR